MSIVSIVSPGAAVRVEAANQGSKHARDLIQ